MAVPGTITKRHPKLLISVGVAILGGVFYVLFKETKQMTVDPESVAMREVAAYAKRQSLAPDLFRLAGRTDGPDGRLLFDYEYEAPLKHALRIDVSKDGSVEVSRMID